MPPKAARYFTSRALSSAFAQWRDAWTGSKQEAGNLDKAARRWFSAAAGTAFYAWASHVTSKLDRQQKVWFPPVSSKMTFHL